MKRWIHNRAVFGLGLIAVWVSIVTCSCEKTVGSGAGDTGRISGETSSESVSAETSGKEAEEFSETEAYVLAKDSPLAGLPEYTYDTWSDYRDLENGAEMLVYTAEDGDGYVSYLMDMEAAGFTLYAENEIAENRFSTWVMDETHVMLMYTPAQEMVRILAETGTDLPGLVEDNVFYTDAGIENVVVQVGVDYDGETGNGMCFIYRLCDGSFMIVDSGFKQTACVEAIYETLAKLAPDPDNIVIAAWFMTHGHSDHVGGFYLFSDTYADKVTLEQVIYNYPPKKSFEISDLSTNHIPKIKRCIDLYGEVKEIEAHPGQVFYVRDAVVEMLYTVDLYRNANVSYMNDSSLIFTVELGDTKLMQLGDCGPQASSIMVKLYGETLDSDIIQVAHHGYKGASSRLNKLINGEIVLWPAGDLAYTALRSESVNMVFDSAEYLYVAGTRATEVPLPFDPEQVRIWELYSGEK